MKNIEKEKLYLIIIIIFLIIFSFGLVLYSHTNNPSLTKNALSRVASFGPLWIFDKNESLINVNAKNNQKERISNDIKQIFEERVKVWLKNNLKKSFEKEFRNHTNQILEKKLK